MDEAHRYSSVRPKVDNFKWEEEEEEWWQKFVEPPALKTRDVHNIYNGQIFINFPRVPLQNAFRVTLDAAFIGDLRKFVVQISRVARGY